MKKQMKFIFVTGGVVSSLGKGISAASIGRLLKRRGLNIFSIKLDPYLNYSPTTMSPLQHGEVFVTKDGAETDLDLGHYERIINTSLTKESSVTSGKIYTTVLERERRGEYGGATIQIIPHITNEIKKRLTDGFKAKGDTDVCIVEIGGTVGDIESLPYFEAIRQLRRELGYENTFFVHNTLVPYLETSGEIKTKPTQHSVKELTGLGIQPDAILLRSHVNIDKASKKKVALFCNVNDESVITVKDVDIIYEVALNLEKQHLDDQIVNHLRLECADHADMSDWIELIKKIRALKKEVTVGLVGKYVDLHDAYLSVAESLKFAGFANNAKVKIKWIDTANIEENPDAIEEIFSECKGIIVPDGTGIQGTEGMKIAIKYARENNIPFFGIGQGMHMALIDIARNLIGFEDANSAEFDDKSAHKIIGNNPELYKNVKLINNMRLGDYECKILEGSLASKLYKSESILERHRTNIEFNNSFRSDFENTGIIFSGINPQANLVELIELKDNDFFIACNFLPEYQSRPLNAHPLFEGFITAALKR